MSNADAIATAKQILQTKGASYRNITFASGSEAGKFALNIMSFPTTYVIDRNGKIVGEPVLGGITNENSMKQLQENIDTAIGKRRKITPECDCRCRYINFQPSDNLEQSVVDDVEYIRNHPLAASNIPIYGYILRCKNRQADRG